MTLGQTFLYMKEKTKFP